MRKLNNTDTRGIGMGYSDLAKKVLERLDRHNSGISKEESSEARELAAECSFQLSILVSFVREIESNLPNLTLITTRHGKID